MPTDVFSNQLSVACDFLSIPNQTEYHQSTTAIADTQMIIGTTSPTELG
jgi:hypothetical protein